MASQSVFLIERGKATGKIAFWYKAFDSDPNWRGDAGALRSEGVPIFLDLPQGEPLLMD